MTVQVGVTSRTDDLYVRPREAMCYRSGSTSRQSRHSPDDRGDIIQAMQKITCLISALLCGAAIAEPLSIDTPASAGSLAPALAPLGDGRLVLTWLENSKDGHAMKFSVYGDGEFGPPGTIADGRDWFANWADTPGLFVLPGGDWLAHWLVKSGPATYAYDVVMARSSDGGRTWSEPFSPHQDGTRSEHGFVSYFADGPDRAGVVWLDGRETVAASELQGLGHAAHGEGAMTLRTATIAGDNAAEAHRLLDDRVCDCCRTASAVTSAGPIVVYRDRSEDEIRDHRVVRRVEGRWTEPELLHDDGWRIGGCPVNGPAMVADGADVAVAWFTMPEGVPQVRLARSHNAGKDFELIDSLGVDEALGRVDLVRFGDGWVVSWMNESKGQASLELARYDARDRVRWTRTIEGLDNSRAAGFPRIGWVGEDRLLVVWTDGGRKEGTQLRAAEVRIE